MILALMLAVVSLTLDAWLVTALVSFLSPAAVAVLTKINASTAVKRVVGLVVAAVIAYIVESTLSNGTAVLSLGTLVLTIVGVIVQQTSYAQLWRLFGLNQHLFPNFGLGRSVIDTTAKSVSAHPSS